MAHCYIVIQLLLLSNLVLTLIYAHIYVLVRSVLFNLPLMQVGHHYYLYALKFCVKLVGGRCSPAVACWASDHWVASSNPLRGKFRH